MGAAGPLPEMKSRNKFGVPQQQQAQRAPGLLKGR
jgi:hypothetical protein